MKNENIRNNSNDIKPAGAGLVIAQLQRNTRSKNTQRGITLVALIITIIILLILATVSISLVINNGVLDKAQHGVEKYSEEEELEQIKLAVASARLKGNGFLTTENLNSELQEKFGETAEVKPINDYWKFNGFKIDSNGQVERTLPKEFQEVENIESTGTQYIDTKIYPNNFSTYEIRGEILFTDVSYEQYIAGCDSNNYNNSMRNRLSFLGIYKAKVVIGRSNWQWASNELEIGKWYDFKSINGQGNQSFYINENCLSTASMSQSNSFLSNIKIFGNELTDAPHMNFHSKSKCKYININIDNIETRKYIPCYATTTVTDVDGISRPKDTIGLYDTVEGKFYVNQGEGTFLKGKDV